MCEFQRVFSNKLPVCDYTKDLCTFCVCGNSKTYNEAISKNGDNGNEKTH